VRDVRLSEATPLVPARSLEIHQDAAHTVVRYINGTARVLKYRRG